MRKVLLGVISLSVGCYSSVDVIPAINAAWVGHSAAELRDEWGTPVATAPQGNQTTLVWRKEHRGYTLPSGSASLTVKPGQFDLEAEVRPGEVTHSSTEAHAVVDAAGVVAHVEGAQLGWVPTWGPPNSANLHWGVLLGFHAGMGRLDDTSTPLPSGGGYIGGMIGPRLGLVGTFSLVAGKDDAGGAMGFAWGFAAQWWPVNRLSLRAGPAMLLSFDPGFNDAALAPGVTTGGSYAFLKSGTFALDLRLDLNLGPSVAFGSVGVGVNVN